MPAPDLRQADFAAALHHLMPPGPAWPREPGTMLDGLLSAMADRAASQHARVVTLADAEAYPAETSEMLPDWERAFGLPDACGHAGDTAAERRAALLARIAERGGQSRAYFIAVAAALGYTVTIDEFRPARIGVATIGTPIYSPEWIFTWRVNAPAETVTDASIGVSVIGDPLRSWGNATLECVIRRIAPARSVVLFGYS